MDNNQTLSASQLTPLLEALIAARNGDFSVRLDVHDDELSEISAAFNDLIALNQNFAHQIVTVSKNIKEEGKFNERLSKQTTNGLWSDSVDAINSLIDNLTQPISNISEIVLAVSRGDLSKQIELESTGAIQVLINNVNIMITNLRNSIHEITGVASTVASSSEEFSAVSKEMTSNASQTAEQATSASASAEQVSQNAMSVATAVEQMNASIREIAKNAAEGAQVATTAVTTADETNETITKLGQSSIEIGKVIKVITSIAQQTNLLALNATIEAARAGDAGRGFAVVAGEVKELAKQTAKATEDISQRIETIQNDTKSAVDAIVDITSIINQINDIQNTIASAVEEQTATTNEISRNVSEAAKGASDIAKNISVVAINAQTTTTGASNTTQAASELSQMAIDLQKVVSKFKF